MAVEDHRVVIGVDYTGQADVQRYLSDLARMAQGSAEARARIEQAMSGQLPLSAGTAARTPLALPAGTGAGAAQMAAQLERAQRDYINGLNVRTRSLEDQARQARFQQRVAQIADRPNAQGLTFGPGGNPMLQFGNSLTEASQSLRSLRTSVARLEAQVQAQMSQFKAPSTTKINAATAEANRLAISGALRQAAQNAPTTGSMTIAGDLAAQIEGMTGSNTSQKRVLHEGIADYRLLERLSPEQRQFLVGTPEHPAALGLRPGQGEPILGATNKTAVAREMREQAVDPQLTRQLSSLKYALTEREASERRVAEQNVLEVGSTERLRQAQERARVAQEAEAAAAERQAKAAERAAAERQAAYDTQRDTASFPRVGLPRPPDPLNGLYHGATNRLPDHLLPASQVGVQKGQLYGPGMYLTDSPAIAQSYATHETGYGVLHQMGRASGRSNVYDMSQELTPDQVEHLRQASTPTDAEAEENIKAAQGMAYTPVARDLPSWRIRSMLDRFKGGEDFGVTVPPVPVTHQKLFEGIPNVSDEPDRKWLSRYIQQQTGANVLRYQGGQFTGGNIKHNAYVALDPENLHTQSATPWSMHDEAEQTALAQRQADVAARGPATFAHALPAGRPVAGALVPGQVSGAQAAALAAQARAADEAARAEMQVSKALVHVRDLVTETYPEYEKARLAVEARARAEEGAARAAVGAGGGGRSGGGSGGGGGGGGTPPPPPIGPGGHREGDDARMHRAAQLWWEKLDEETRAMKPSAFDDVFRAASRFKRATDHAAEVMNKGNKPLGKEGGFETEAARTKAYRSSTEAEMAAAKNLAAAEKRLAETMAKEAAARERRTAPVDTGQVHGPGMPLTQQTQASVVNALGATGALSPVQVAQQNLTQAQGAQAAAIKAHQQVMNGTYLNQQQAGNAYAASLGRLSAAGTAVQQAQAKLATATQTATAAANNAAGGGAGGGGRGGFFANFGKGFRGNPDTPIATQLGQTARFSVFYGSMYRALFMITQTLQNAVTEGIAFEDAMTNLSIAAGRPKEELNQLAAQLGSESVRAGFAPSQGVEIGARSLGLYGLAGAGADPEQQRQVATTSARVVSQLAVGSGKTPVELQGDIGAIAQALGLGASGQQRIADLDAYMTKRFGVQQGSTLQAVSESASVGKAAGFSNPQLFAIAAEMTARTGQTPSAVAGYMAQIFSRGGEGSLVNVASKQGINPNQDLSKILEKLAAVYQSADPREQAQISSAFGRGKVQNAVVALLGNYGAVQSASRDGVTGANGAANKQFDQHMANIGGQLRELGGEFHLFAQELGEAGLLDGLAAMALALKGLVGAANTLLGMFIQLPRPLRDAAVGLALFAAASKMGIVSAVGSRLVAAGGTALTPMIGPLVAGQAIRPLVTASGAAAGQAVGFGTAAATAGKGLLRLLGPIGLAIGGLIAMASLKSSADKARAAQDSATGAIRSGGALNPNTSSAEDFRSHAAELRAQADQNRHATGWFSNAITFGHANDSGQETARQLEAEAKRLDAVAAGIKDPGSQNRPTMFQSLGTEDVKTGLDSITQSGGTAQTQLKALRDVLYATAGAAKTASEAFDPKKFAAGAVSGLQSDALGAIGGLGQVGGHYISGGRAGGGATPIDGKDILNGARSALDGPTMQRRLRRQLEQRGIHSEGDIGPTQAGQIAQAMAGPAADDIIKEVGPSIAGSRNKIMKALQQAFKARLLADAKKQRNLLKGDAKLSNTDAAGLADSITTTSETRLGDLGQTDNKGRIAELRKRIQDLNAINNRRTGGGVLPSILLKISQARSELVDSQLSEIDSVRKAAMANARTRAAATAAGQSALRQSIGAIVKNGNADQLANLLAGAGREANAMARAAIHDALVVEQAALAAEKELSRTAAAAIAANPSLGKPRMGPGGEQGGDPGVAVRSHLSKKQKAIQREMDRLNSMDQALNTPGVGPKDDKYKASGIDVYNPYWNNDKAKKDKQKKDESELEKQAAQERAAAAASRSPVAAARAQMTTARAAMQKAVKEQGRNSVEYWDAVGQYNDAQNALADALAAVPAARASAKAAHKNGQIAQAKAGLVAARMQMKNAEGDQAAYFQGLAALYQSQWALRAALEAYRKNVMLLHVDMTNPLRQAQVETRAAAMKLRDDARHGAGRDVLAQDRVDLRSARANQESTAFQQRLQAVQTADNLGRITHQTYMNYLSHEHDRLTAVRHRTYQQQQELDQIDGLMKDAAQQMQGQFNLGDIKLPTPYQVRRYIKSQAQGLTANGTSTAVTNNNVSMTFQGYDPKQIEKTVAKVVGKSARTMTTAARRR